MTNLGSLAPPACWLCMSPGHAARPGPDPCYLWPLCHTDCH
uniref:Uncharacterized protein n=1 Tax=Anguilla anguilla TaxID=7936 RepID=A0A0E9VUP4_ANGAN